MPHPSYQLPVSDLLSGPFPTLKEGQKVKPVKIALEKGETQESLKAWLWSRIDAVAAMLLNPDIMDKAVAWQNLSDIRMGIIGCAIPNKNSLSSEDLEAIIVNNINKSGASPGLQTKMAVQYLALKNKTLAKDAEDTGVDHDAIRKVAMDDN